HGCQTRGGLQSVGLSDGVLTFPVVGTSSSALEHRIRTDLEHLRRQLDLVQSGLIVATHALKNQDAEQDREIANLLEFAPGPRLDGALERSRALIVSLEPRPASAAPDAPEDSGGSPAIRQLM